jgi:Zn-finger nucleic acid-binding protein
VILAITCVLATSLAASPVPRSRPRRYPIVLCPVDNETLLLSERQGIEIDYCPKCRGVWLDRGELDKLLQRDDDEWRQTDRRRDDDREWDRDDDHGGSRYPKKKKRWLSEMFEMD